jgi:hypothetical protein
MEVDMLDQSHSLRLRIGFLVHHEGNVCTRDLEKKGGPTSQGDGRPSMVEPLRLQGATQRNHED